MSDYGGLTVHLREQAAQDWQRALGHPLIEQAANGTLPMEVFERFVLINTHFLRTYRRFMMVMGTIAPDVRASKLMFANSQSVDHEIADSEEFAQRHGLGRLLPSARAMDYTSFVMACSGQGWVRGLVVTYALESLFYECWASVWTGTDVAPEILEFVDTWSQGYQADNVQALRALVDPLRPTPEIERTYNSVLRSEIAAWDEAFDSALPRRRVDARRRPDPRP
ncbi:MAG: hypothetical protein M3419_03270 [Actinomycetota bacterium]|nr:hypothetical protein [Actinomycetota bacterium]